MRTVLCTFLLLFAASTWAADGEAQIREAEKAWAAAVMAGDADRLSATLADTLIYAHATGTVETKQKYLDRLRSGAQKYERIVQESVRVAPYGDTVVTHSVMRMIGLRNGQPFNDHVMMMHTWVKQGGTWKLVAHQTAKLDS